MCRLRCLGAVSAREAMCGRRCIRLLEDFNPRLRVGGDTMFNWMANSIILFQSTPPGGRRQSQDTDTRHQYRISIHASTREATTDAHRASDIQGNAGGHRPVLYGGNVEQLVQRHDLPAKPQPFSLAAVPARDSADSLHHGGRGGHSKRRGHQLHQGSAQILHDHRGDASNPVCVSLCAKVFCQGHHDGVSEGIARFPPRRGGGISGMKGAD